MAQIYDIEIKEELSRVEKIEADSLDEAISKAMDLYYGQKVILDAEDMKGVDFKPFTQEHEKTR
ncbi:MAG: DpnD/PcfM family protein [Anaerostipes sp.]|uniref:DpnD/PcfM family protein n=1 Tax=Enterocloster bolteae TaxID=208479 RepID=UPI00210ADE0A|nr:DpnD/PcfM family protein [Enterocloster bolteae]MCQ4756941.1 DpnD/PcfM family protein [Enterocloster bolteae]MDD4370711.1 DpnD/PcfM family protein [Anaerostipes sp.]